MTSGVDPAGIGHLVLLGHPAPGSFNHSMAMAYCAAVRACGQSATLRDLYAIGFNPLLGFEERPDADFAPAADVAAELDLIRASQVITLVYPIWFGMPPAIIKGYIDRVLGAGFSARAIKTGDRHELLQGKHLVILSSSAATRPWLDERGQLEALRQAFDSYLTTIFSLHGCDHVHFDAVVSGMSAQVVREDIEIVETQARKTCSEVIAERHALQAEQSLARRHS
ncbi:NAD(P)H-dependent oxidoreductase [Sphingomonas oligophenolica]|uniref:NAD(P)H-dependent oxidoreductase n=1 Tax=Sphingomonas oligophenolica TaxID=301154 RepID=A0ABU9Y7M3_9SPHN